MHRRDSYHECGGPVPGPEFPKFTVYCAGQRDAAGPAGGFSKCDQPSYFSEPYGTIPGVTRDPQ
eukprot:755445-Hanusia_phi.AAC.1